MADSVDKPGDITEEEDFEEAVEPTPEELKVVTQAYDLSLQTLHEQWQNKSLVLPNIQREYVWDNGKASRLIESLILNIPIPAVYFAESEDATFEVIDGHQRVRSISRFFNNEFHLQGINLLTHLRGLRFHRLEQRLQRRLRGRILRAIVIQPESHDVAKFEVFERLNSGAISLTAQELRNSIYRGPYNDCLKRLATESLFRRLIGSDRPRKRMVDEELVLRYLALEESLNTYRPSLKRFLNLHMGSHRNASENVVQAAIHKLDAAIQKIGLVFPGRGFRVHDDNGEPQERSVNKALYDAHMLAFSWTTVTPVEGQLGDIRANLAGLFDDDEFLDSVQRATGDRSRTLLRVKKTIDALQAAGLEVTPPYELDATEQ